MPIPVVHAGRIRVAAARCSQQVLFWKGWKAETADRESEATRREERERPLATSVPYTSLLDCLTLIYNIGSHLEFTNLKILSTFPNIVTRGFVHMLAVSPPWLHRHCA